jgi:SpoVK/Ycf46/Vps4 family AAA+-type ATPase
VLVQATVGYSGSDLKELCRAALLAPVQDLMREEEQQGIASQEACSPHTLAVLAVSRCPAFCVKVSVGNNGCVWGGVGVDPVGAVRGGREGRAGAEADVQLRPLRMDDIVDAKKMVRAP